ncbi:MAG TPA: NPCBM/NEW2 domain-containing protein [Pyrinomonadaceae bacterium]|nr:NPCBM/NEW2 domain-containing protein [Pyrinomonadaceae bacterium]
MRLIVGFLSLISLLGIGLLSATPQLSTAHTHESKTDAVPNRDWPHPIPLRVRDGANRNLMVTTLGDVKTSLADGMYDPVADRATLKDGSLVEHYYRDKLGVKYFQPLDKKDFPLPPSGWCTWYYYYQQINENEVKQNARWIADNLKDYGAQYVQIDDGWQGTGRVYTRDWTNVSDKFPSGMGKLAGHIKSVGLTPGIWIAPHGQSNDAVVKNLPAIFLMKPDGTSASESWEGRYLVDPSIPESQKYMKDLFTKLAGWGYEYFKIDGQPVVVNEYRNKKSFMKKQGDDTVALYRETLKGIREAIGPQRYLLGCWGMPIEGAGIMNGSRTGGDVVLDWAGGFMLAMRATMQNYYLHNIVWYTDADTMLVRSPLTLDQARAWATLQGLTGQAIMDSDRTMDLSEERVELLRRVYPAVDIRPLDLFPAERNKQILDLKINHLGRNYDVVGLFNYDEAKSEQINLNWKDLDLPENSPIHVYDFWNNEYLGAWEHGMTFNLSPTSCRVLTLIPSTGKVQLISTNRHITQGWVDLVSLNSNEATNTFTGKSNVVKNDHYELSFVFPREKNFKIKSATARNTTTTLPVKIANHQGWATVQMISPRTTQVSWSILFEPAEIYHYPVREPANLFLERAGLDSATLKWNAQYYLNAGYQVYLNGALVGFTPTNTFTLRELDPDANYSVEVKTVWDDGTASERKTELKFTLKSLMPQEMSLATLTPLRPGIGGRGIEINRALTGRPFSIAGQHYEGGIGARANLEIEYDLKAIFDTLSALVGIDDATNNQNAAIEFVVLGDGKELWRSGSMKKSEAAKPLKIDITGVRHLVLRVTGGGDGQGPQARILADWVNANLTRK